MTVVAVSTRILVHRCHGMLIYKRLFDASRHPAICLSQTPILLNDFPLGIRAAILALVSLCRPPMRALPPIASVVLVALSMMVGGCAVTQPAVQELEAESSNENLHSVLWTQTSVEFTALTEQIYLLATHRLDDALADTSWTASIEQQETGSYGTLRPAIVLDIDETVLDNSRYQARLVESNTEYSTSTWQDWVREENATAIPGALEFVLEAQRRGIYIVYLTNRRAETEASTRANLRALGFPVSEEFDAVVSRGERADWDTSDKRTRRQAIADRFRIIMLIGDNLGDFISGAEQSIAVRRAMTESFDDYWGERWFMLPNPQYGSWEGALFDHDNSLSREARLRTKRAQLDTGN